jgi:hypothetical protein
MSRYRPNIVLIGTELFEEYTWLQVQIGPVVFEITRVCDRCSVTTIEQETASQNCESLVTLASFPNSKDTKPVFGLHATPLTLGEITLNSAVSIIKYEDAKALS